MSFTPEKVVEIATKYIKRYKWWEIHNSRISLANYMYDKDYFRSIVEVIYFFEKPWKYEQKWKEYQDSPRIKPKRVKTRCKQ